jgi:hypothetical protein
MTDQNKSHATAAALLGLPLTAPLNPHGQCFGLIPAGGDWLDDLIDWSRRQFKRPEDAQRIAASWNALIHVPLAQLMEPSSCSTEAVKLRLAIAACKAKVTPPAAPKELNLHFVSAAPDTMSADLGNRRFWAVYDIDADEPQTAAAPPGFAATILALNAALRALQSEVGDEVGEFANDEDEEEHAPVQFATRKVADAILLLYGVSSEAAPTPSAGTVDEQMQHAVDAAYPLSGPHAILNRDAFRHGYRAAAPAGLSGLTEAHILEVAKKHFGWASGLGGFDDAVLHFAAQLSSEARASEGQAPTSAAVVAMILEQDCGHDIGPARQGFYEGARGAAKIVSQWAVGFQTALESIARGWDGANVHGIYVGKGRDVGADLRESFAKLGLPVAAQSADKTTGGDHG